MRVGAREIAVDFKEVRLIASSYSPVTNPTRCVGPNKPLIDSFVPPNRSIFSRNGLHCYSLIYAKRWKPSSRRSGGLSMKDGCNKPLSWFQTWRYLGTSSCIHRWDGRWSGELTRGSRGKINIVWWPSQNDIRYVNGAGLCFYTHAPSEIDDAAISMFYAQRMLTIWR
jgi:hypothetical protein